MKQIFLLPLSMAIALASTSINAEVLAHDDFSNGTTQGWDKGDDAGLPVTVETEADGNKYIKLISEGPTSEHRDKKVVFFKEGGNWRGNFNTKGVTAISARFKNMGAEPLEIHIAIGNTLADLRTRYVVIQGATIANDGKWHEAVFPMAASGFQFVPLGGHGKSSASFSAQETLGNIKEVKFTTGTLGVDYDDKRGPYNGFTGSPELVAELWIDDIKLIK